MREIDSMAVKASTDNDMLNLFIQQNEYYIIKCVSAITHRFITKSDDEWSIALHAFTEAVQGYQFEKGSFYSYSELVIRRRLIDYYRSQEKYQQEVFVDPVIFETEPEEETDNISVHLAVVKQVTVEKDDSLKLEIAAANETLSHYGFTFFELTDCSPHSQKTKSACAKAITYIMSNPLFKQDLFNTKQLPLKIIEKNTKVPRKLLERHRKYIIAAVEILSGEYPHLAEYLLYIREEIGK
ncbi:RNA polymerase sigma-I factor [Anaerocolumna sp. MB42-C2]|uniref:RNA polymerase sigma-I factor n=1 Tax=Anaerocolumna sp. MB42-C2 TaxID=3070997 RepID=UPI0027DFBFA4|nr:RNA polymerase sigma-I factor [Anaerocolumna sp. MB42-C2]WMJ87867.1 RNA polymerase sigma-I factor [Anaerocolumna sp. MB42-C2]